MNSVAFSSSYIICSSFCFLFFVPQQDALMMKSTLSKGMPYATMIYDTLNQMVTNANQEQNYVPTVAAEIAFAQTPVVDEAMPLLCLDLNNQTDSDQIKPMLVQRDIELFFAKSDFKWIMFVSEPVYVQCIISGRQEGLDGVIQIQVLEYATEPEIDRPFIMRTALSKLCTSGAYTPIYCHQEKMHPTGWFLGQGNYDQQLRSHYHLFPGPNTSFDYEVIEIHEKDGSPASEQSKEAILKFDWNVQNMREYALHPVLLNNTYLNERNDSLTTNGTYAIAYGSGTDVITYALPHHFDMINEKHPTDYNIYCVNTLIGPACLYEGSKWNLKQDIPMINFTAPRPPAPWALASLGTSLKTDLKFKLPRIYEKGIGDTYFSGKMLAKFARILIIADEITTLCQSTDEMAVSPEYVDACNSMEMPSVKSRQVALERLKRSVEIWINGSAVTPFVYDPAWGGVVSCGCAFRSEINTCGNKFPDCPGFFGEFYSHFESRRESKQTKMKQIIDFL
jgi:Glycosyl hydrolase family 81 C-terminal domain